ncbi:hypothetical protein P7C73_g12, partial [Tremellales sp. Uapishka_1]
MLLLLPFFSSLVLVLGFALPRPGCASTLPRTSCAISAYGSGLQGYDTGGGACRYTMRYGDIGSRWAYSTLATELANQSAVASLPPSCPQDTNTYNVGPTQSEDCLYAVVYVPQSPAPSSGWPIFVWLHGGSFVSGSAAAPGLDGSALASRGNMIVVVLQYRLGVLGNLPPSQAPSDADPNLALKDVILALEAIHTFASYIGGDATKVTIGGQSSGASLIRGDFSPSVPVICAESSALWGAPASSGLFRAAILQSDPMSYGFAPSSTTSTLQAGFYASTQLANCTTLACLQSVPVADIISAQDDFTSTAFYVYEGLPLPETIRPTYGTATLPSDPTSLLYSSPSTLTHPPSTLPLLLSTTANEAGSIIQEIFPSPILIQPETTNTTFFTYLTSLLGSARADALFNSSYYVLPNITGYGANNDAFRETFERLVTDGAWRSPNRDAGRQWAKSGGKVWIGEWRQGITYPDNQVENGYCLGKVCHEVGLNVESRKDAVLTIGRQDDIYPTFGTAPHANSSVTSFESQILKYWSAFITNLDPNPSLSSTKSWKPFTSSSTSADVFALGGDGQVTPGPPTGFWGGQVQYDWQLYG